MELPAAVALGLRRARARLLGVRVERGRECERFGSPGRAWAGQGEGAGMSTAERSAAWRCFEGEDELARYEKVSGGIVRRMTGGVDEQ